MHDLNRQHGSEDLLLKIGISRGPCLAVMLNERTYFLARPVNIAARVQGLADCVRSFTTSPVVDHPETAALLAAGGRTRCRSSVSSAVSPPTWIYGIRKVPRTENWSRRCLRLEHAAQGSTLSSHRNTRGTSLPILELASSRS